MINNDSSNEFTHLAKTQKGSSGSPIFLKGKNKVIGIHKEGSTMRQENYGDFISPIISLLTFDIMAKFHTIIFLSHALNHLLFDQYIFHCFHCHLVD